MALPEASMQPSALIVTLQMDPEAASHFTALRTRYFPAERNWLDAHITLFHALPLEAVDEAMADLAETASLTEPFPMRVDKVYFLGGGVAYALSAEPAFDIRRELARRWMPMMGRQDRAWRGPLHITVQNKVPAVEAKRLYEELNADFRPIQVQAVGLQLWEYLGGPWRLVANHPFK
ncbi:2'-5' RNA ligase family protein [Xylophilus sp. Kf1]|nr:2'-5' RNA ligase family protein [Xylophilus sp. Kf1]